MSKEAMKLALEALEKGKYYAKTLMMSQEPFDAAIKALAEQPAQPTTTENNGGKTGWPPGLLQDDCKGLSKWLSNKPDAKRRVREALDKMAENARELGIQMQPAQQEPVAWMYPDDYERMTTSETFCTVYSVEVGSATRGETTVALYTSPPAQRTWQGLPDEEIEARAINFYNPEMYKRAVLWAQEKLKDRNQ